MRDLRICSEHLRFPVAVQNHWFRAFHHCHYPLDFRHKSSESAKPGAESLTRPRTENAAPVGAAFHANRWAAAHLPQKFSIHSPVARRAPKG